MTLDRQMLLSYNTKIIHTIKIENWTIKIGNFCTSKNLIMKIKIEMTDREEIFSSHLLTKELYPGYIIISLDK